MLSKNFDLIIVGGGVLGAFHAFHALEKGLSVALVEKDNFPIGASTQNFGQVVPSGMNIKWQSYGRKSLEIYKEIQAKFDISVSQNGSIYLASNQEELQLIEELHEINISNNYSSILLSKNECYTKYPSMHESYCLGGLFFPEELSVNPRILIYKLIEFLIHNKGLVYLNNALVQQIDTSAENSSRVLFSNQESMKATKVIVCSGTEFRNLYPKEFLQSDIELVKLQMLKLKPQSNTKILGNILTGSSIRRYESFQDCPSYKEIKEKEDPKSFWKKWGIHILFKQENDGSIILGDSHEYASVLEQNNLDTLIKNDINHFFLAEAKKIFHLDNWEINNQWTGLYSQCRENDIYLNCIDNKVHIVTGIGGKGMTASAGFAYENINRIYN